MGDEGGQEGTRADRRRKLWARTYAQYIATRGGDARLRAELAVVQGATDDLWRAHQWQAEDLGDIAAAIDVLFVELGWRTP